MSNGLDGDPPSSMRPLTVKGILPYRLCCAASFLAAALMCLVYGISEIHAGGRPFLGLAEGAVSSVSFSLCVRSLASRVVVRDAEVTLYSIWRTIRFDVGRVAGVAHSRFFGWDVLALKLADGSSIRLPALTQPGDPARLRAYEDALIRAFSKD